MHAHPHACAELLFPRQPPPASQPSTIEAASLQLPPCRLGHHGRCSSRAEACIKVAASFIGVMGLLSGLDWVTVCRERGWTPERNVDGCAVCCPACCCSLMVVAPALCAARHPGFYTSHLPEAPHTSSPSRTSHRPWQAAMNVGDAPYLQHLRELLGVEHGDESSISQHLHQAMAARHYVSTAHCHHVLYWLVWAPQGFGLCRGSASYHATLQPCLTLSSGPRSCACAGAAFRPAAPGIL